jgi:ABC-type dipeptide/oligopeptide/nickel transport system permease component
MGLRAYIVRRIAQTVPLLFAVIIMTFLLVHTAPGDPTIFLVGTFGADESYLQEIRKAYGLDKPVYEQLVIYLGKVIRGDLGYSIVFKAPVWEVIGERIPNTFLLMGLALSFATIVGIFLGAEASRKPYSLRDNIITTTSLMGYSIPAFWLALMLILVFSLFLGWFPSQGMETVGAGRSGIAYAIDVLKHLVLPAMTLGLVNLALITRLTRAAMLEQLSQDYIVTAWAKGLDETTVLYRHGLRNSLLSVTTIVGLMFGTMLSGAILTETVFAYPGFGQLLYWSVTTRDYPVVMGEFIVMSIMVILATLITDVIYAFLDPRISYK